MIKLIAITIVLVPVVAFAVKIPTGDLGLDWRTDAPTGKNWEKVTEIHYFNKKSIKKVKGAIYQATICNHLDTPAEGGVWNYWDIRVDCKSKQSSERYSGGWLDFSSPSDYEEAAMKYICK